MKRIIATLSVIMLITLCANAQKENPRGLYRLQNLTYDSTPDVVTPEFMQYKYCADFASLQIVVSEDEYGKGGMTVFSMYNNDGKPLNYTGKELNGEDGKGVRIFDSNKSKFTLSWYNSDYENHMYFPLNEFIHEHYSSKKGVSKNIKRAIEVFTNPIGKKTNKFIGVWRRRCFTSSYDITGNGYTYPGSEMYRIHTDKEMFLLYSVQNEGSYVYANCEMRPCTYYNDNATQEGSLTCLIKWIDDDCFSLTCIIDGKELQSEIWDRCGLPEGFQKIFGTNVPINKIEIPQKDNISITRNPELLLGTWTAEHVVVYCKSENNSDSISYKASYTITYEKDGTCHGTVSENINGNNTIYTFTDKYSLVWNTLTYEKCAFTEFIARPEIRDEHKEMELFTRTNFVYVFQNDSDDGEVSYSLYTDSQRGYSLKLTKKIEQK